MSKSASLLRLKAKPGRRDDVMRVWERYARDYTAKEKGFLSFYYCYEDNDPDAIVVFGLANKDSVEAFAQQPWFSDYQRDTQALLAETPEVCRVTAIYAKGGA